MKSNPQPNEGRCTAQTQARCPALTQGHCAAQSQARGTAKSHCVGRFSARRNRLAIPLTPLTALAAFTVFVFVFVFVSPAKAGESEAVEDLNRAISLLDATIDKCFTGTSMKMYDTYDTATHRGDGTADVWPYTAALEATCSVLEALDILRPTHPDLYDAHHDRLVTRLADLFSNLAYYNGSYRLNSYAQRARWSIYGVHRASSKGKANVMGIENVYDDQMWICRELIRAYRLTSTRAYLDEATMLADYCLDGWDICLDANGKEYGGISWGPGYNSKHSCSNGPLIQPLVWLHDIWAEDDATYVHHYIDAEGNRLTTDRMRSEVYADYAAKLYAWQKSHLLNTTTGVYYDMLGADNTIQYVTAPDGLKYRTHVATGNPGGTAFTYNTGTMIAGAAELLRLTADEAFATDLRKLTTASWNNFGKWKRVDDVRMREFPTDAKATSGFNCWFNDVLMRACVDATHIDADNASFAVKILESFQENLDYAWSHFLNDSFLPINLLEGWGGATITKGFHQLAFASEYAMLAVWHMQTSDATNIIEAPFEESADHPAPGETHTGGTHAKSKTYALSGQRISDGSQASHPTILIKDGRKQMQK